MPGSPGFPGPPGGPGGPDGPVAPTHPGIPLSGTIKSGGIIIGASHSPIMSKLKGVHGSISGLIKRQSISASYATNFRRLNFDHNLILVRKVLYLNAAISEYEKVPIIIWSYSQY